MPRWAAWDQILLQDGLKRLENALDSEDILRALDLCTLSIQPGEPTPGIMLALMAVSERIYLPDSSR